MAATTSMNKFYQRKKTINGTEYTAQFSGLSNAMRAIDSSYIDGTSNISTEKITAYVLENVIVDPPHLKVDDFDDIDTLNAVVRFGQDVMQGRFRNADTATEKTAG